MRTKTLMLALLIPTLLALVMPSAAAHTGIDVGGGYKVVIGWQNEPPIADQPNAVLIRVSKPSSDGMGHDGTSHDGMDGSMDRGGMDMGNDSMEMQDGHDGMSMHEDAAGGDAGPTFSSFEEAMAAEGKTFTSGDLTLKLLHPPDPNAAPVGKVPFTVLLYDAQQQTPVTDATTLIETWMAPHDGMGGHGTGAQEDPTHDAHGIYRGMANYAMEGWWWTWVNGTAPGYGDFSYKIDVHALSPEGEAAMDDDAVTGIANDIKVTLRIAGKQTTLSFEELDDEPGTYVATVMPTVPGVYNATFSGEINGVPLDVARDLQRVESPAIIAFPEPPQTNYQMQQRVAQLEQQLEAVQAQQAAQALSLIHI